MQIIKFASVGSVGFLVDSVTLLLLNMVMPLELARFVSFWLAASTNWWMNRHWTFSNAGFTLDKFHFSAPSRAIWREWLKFLMSSVVGFIPNMLCYLYLINTYAVAREMPVISLIPGILIGMLFNFLLSKYWVFKAT